MLMFSADMSKYFGKDSTPGGIGFQFRQIKQYAKSQKQCADSGGDPQTLGIGAGKGEDASAKGGQSIAGQYGQGVTGGAGDGSAKSTPRKRTPSKKKVEQYTGSNEDDDEDFNFSTPSKTKTPLNKVKNGRVVKKQQKDDRNMLSSFTDIDNNDDDEVQIVKKEAKPQMSFNGMENGQGFSRGFGHSYVEDQDEDQDIYEDADEA
ncbi:hypothetical protein M430DRAFT_214677 [Amorphotheca resinae ATCC 22711]|uniref:Uncharacterized protein n=1 Tax=Amorphotheca resinae ATCC 22711 TaxID=857342 RepID=A0A2T3B8N8_AMORE|nr:hypothetical protein M430DRAFT_214677 [Amorphotheca resinae ATCC 22711]PSS23213.1 hypothetical protein M430DRAFT_214677 [Amorphotheca resinae ATCC 22711]